MNRHKKPDTNVPDSNKEATDTKAARKFRRSRRRKRFGKFLLILLALVAIYLAAKALWSATHQVTLTFDPNYTGAKSTQISVTQGKVIDQTQVPELTREGWYFAGWYTVANPVLTNGYSDTEWLSGKKYLYKISSPAQSETTGEDNPDSMPIRTDTTLYARWVRETPVSTPEDLKAIAEDLTGYYVLTQDIDLSNEGTWEGIGTYASDYESANANWWQQAFRGTLDGNGHTITGLTLNNCDDTAISQGLFKAVSDAEIKNLTLKDYQIDIANHSFLYTGPLAGFGQGSHLRITNVHTNGLITIRVENTTSDVLYTAATGLVGAAWGGTIQNCSTSGAMSATFTVPNGAEVNIGGINGEGYTSTKSCTSTMDIQAALTSQSQPVNDKNEDKACDLYIGGIQGGATNVESCTASGTITAGVTKPTGESNLYAGGIAGQIRYNQIKNCLSTEDLTILDGKNIYIGGIAGSWNQTTYRIIGYLGGERSSSITNSLAAGKMTLQDGYDHETVTAGGAVSSIPEAFHYLIFYKKGYYSVNNIAALTQNLTWKDQPLTFGDLGEEEKRNNIKAAKPVELFETPEQMQGKALESILGTDAWEYTEGSMPTPK